MTITIIIAILAIAFIATYAWYINHVRIDVLSKKYQRKAKKAQPRPNNIKQAKPSPYRCVVMVNTENGCRAAKELQSKLILMNEAATLPLSKCDQQVCECRYKRYEDRRMSDRRDVGNPNAIIIGNAQKNRRHMPDRRKKARDYNMSLEQQTISLI